MTDVPGILLDLKERQAAALELAYNYSQIDGDHHKAWVIDQMVRALTGDDYEQWVKDYETNEDDPDDSYEWSEGIAP